MSMNDTELRRAEDLGHSFGRTFAARNNIWPERADCAEAWISRTSERAEGPAFDVFARVALERAAAELAAESSAECGEEERAEIAEALRCVLRIEAKIAKTTIARAEALRTVLRGSLRYGLVSLAQQAAERLADNQTSA